MSGTDRSRQAALGKGAAPAVILVAPQLGENIGMAARAMLNCGLADLRLVRPRDGWPNPKAVAAASGADAVLAKARIFDTTEAAIADLQRVYASTARPRGMTITVVSPEEAAREMRQGIAGGLKIGVLFGSESAGLDNDDIVLADTIVTVPLNPGFSSLNLAQAVFAIGYAWYRQPDLMADRTLTIPKRTQPASKAYLLALFEHLERELDESAFFLLPEKRPTMVRNLRNFLQRGLPTEQEVRTLRGVITSLTKKKKSHVAKRRAMAVKKG